ncbi:uncharacterized protein LOC106171231 [Lingula anatina]|uniref:Uncharacterized protein LOC106171231 n=1 Tax=Lingula anatina TaxID=7574 RepID=A0A1S3J941_LINAN|nr:uncharacterized protein LOC106171231 [Lingula anatina]|eukprot:XP_013406922.1 uncharacterized protein LOC106171231 [Lingula anatina]
MKNIMGQSIVLILLLVVGHFGHSDAEPSVCGDMPPVIPITEDTLPGTLLLNFANSSIPGVTDIVIEGLEPADGFVSLNISRRAFVLKNAIDAENMTQALSYKVICKYKQLGLVKPGVIFFFN